MIRLHASKIHCGKTLKSNCYDSLIAFRYATIAYSGQQPWLQNGTIRDNILFGESYHPKRYDKTIESCALKADVDAMPNGDLTQVGERGHNLSGGQKMRISLARAFYSSANIIILVTCKH